MSPFLGDPCAKEAKTVLTGWGFGVWVCGRNLENRQSQEGMRQALHAYGVPGTIVFSRFPTHSPVLKVLLVLFCQKRDRGLSLSPSWEGMGPGVGSVWFPPMPFDYTSLLSKMWFCGPHREPWAAPLGL